MQVREWCLPDGCDTQSANIPLYVDSQFISLTLQDIEYLSRMFIIVQQQLRNYIVALQDVLPYVTATLTSVTHVEPAPEASKNINFSHLHEDLISFV